MSENLIPRRRTVTDSGRAMALTRCRCGQLVVCAFPLETTNHRVFNESVENNAGNEPVCHRKPARARKASNSAASTTQKTHAMTIAEPAMGIEIFIAHIEPMLFCEAPYAGFHPRIAPAEKEARQIRQ